MRDGASIRVSLNSPIFEGETLPTWIGALRGPPAILDASAVVHQSEKGERSIRLAVVNRSETESYTVALRIAFENVVADGADIEVHELWHEDVKARNGWGKENEVSVQTRTAKWNGSWTFREHSFTLLILRLR